MSHKILVVDDSEIARQELVGPLKGAGYSTLEAESGQDGLKVVEADDAISLIITDVHMPVMNGIEMCEEIQKLGRPANPPILVVSTESNTEMKERGKKAGVSGWVIKPVNTDKLVQVAKMLIERNN